MDTERAKQALILGLFREDDLAASVSGCVDVWTMNDWYRPYPWLKYPAGILNLHTEQDVTDVQKQGRYPGDWRKEYRDSGAMIFVPPGVAFDGIITVEFPVDEILAAYPEAQIRCAVSAMIYLVAILGYREISMRGVRLRDSEYFYQVKAIIAAISDVSGRGVTVNCPYMEEWKTRTVADMPGPDPGCRYRSLLKIA